MLSEALLLLALRGVVLGVALGGVRAVVLVLAAVLLLSPHASKNAQPQKRHMVTCPALHPTLSGHSGS